MASVEDSDGAITKALAASARKLLKALSEQNGTSFEGVHAITLVVARDKESGENVYVPASFPLGKDARIVKQKLFLDYVDALRSLIASEHDFGIAAMMATNEMAEKMLDDKDDEDGILPGTLIGEA